MRLTDFLIIKGGWLLYPCHVWTQYNCQMFLRHFPTIPFLIFRHIVLFAKHDKIVQFQWHSKYLQVHNPLCLQSLFNHTLTVSVLTETDSPFIYLNEIIFLFQKCSNHPLNAFRYFTSRCSATSSTFDFSIGPDTGIELLCTCQSHSYTYLSILVPAWVLPVFQCSASFQMLHFWFL